MARVYDREYHHNYHKKKSTRIKTEVMTYYGGGKPACSVCGEGRLACLTIDHINGNGAAHRKEIGGCSGIWFYKWLQKNDYPDGYQTLCMNCQYVKRDLYQEYGWKEQHGRASSGQPSKY